ncbi:MAG: flippase-like domain-containing protein [Bacteroidales bacterium]|nr:flippase-like domain-containing protein [Bacteroidales bacterium]
MHDVEPTESTSDVRKWYKRIPQLILFVGLGFFFVWLSLRHLNAEDRRTIMTVIGSVNTLKGWLMLGLAAFFALLADYFRALRGKILLQPLHYEVRTSMMFYSVMVCFMANLALPRLGEVLRCTFLQRYEKVPFQKSLGTVITERAVDIVFWLVMLVIAIMINTDLLNNLVVDADAGLTVRQWMEAKGLSLLGNHLLLMLLGVALLLALVLWMTRNWWKKNKFFLKIWHFCQGLWQGFISIKDVQRPWRYWFWTVMMWVAYFFGTYTFFFAMPCLTDVSPSAGYSVLIFGTIAFMVAQGGIGAYPLIVAGVLMLYGVDYTSGLAAGWVGWILQTVVSLAGGFVSLVLASFTRKRDSMVLTEN